VSAKILVQDSGEHLLL